MVKKLCEKQYKKALAKLAESSPSTRQKIENFKTKAKKKKNDWHNQDYAHN